ncbi:Maf family nucleotide pyrophosphatase [Sediminitomix flava]|uniref:dTTP/UTP pyrophosphatase n=1 Tax=Sediminitomix flava TaxID=379075 RepID=A0A315ZCE9_SEDFL|nr:Maf family nucleotide pyrophosphatase [Sediminitomix flava]PWJ42498.1 septum formation protein [Sediminitomix flava]
MDIGKKIILASNSPRRKQLLQEMGFTFEVRTKPTEEVYPKDLEAAKVAEYLAVLKASPFKNELEEIELVVTSDTTVIVEDEILGKPKDAEEAFEMIQKLSGKSHDVTTGVCLMSKDKEVSFSDSTTVTFRSLSEDEIKYYIENYKPYDKAGAYGIQEWIGLTGITEIKGSYFTVMGLPTVKLYEALKSF